ncbi:hypothetical protein THF5H11_60074 [Vibrio jasicida]|uniref:Uncharacterized protein n=1 Tax=Vibrio jasicida TaxID=766224 RepID=A0AAU9QKS9_9VIBR|nr:hypothetical protein THF5H11_60074 [Vibrio jasicida]CAH1579715.1 hypothetical protein THF1C08_210076 [Vibrio jasicida]CAH1590520.1 hypothetical protein THF1A12_220075 [Vibrio jasicida]CAH1609187.1 hypothetical protein THF5G08_80212 [Vibrio jasicida]
MFRNTPKRSFSLMFTKFVDLTAFKSLKCNFVTKNNISLYFIYALKLILLIIKSL